MPLLRAITPVPAFVRIQTIADFAFERIDGHGVRQVRQHVPHCQLLRFLDKANDILHITGCCLSNHMKSTSDLDRNQTKCHEMSRAIQSQRLPVDQFGSLKHSGNSVHCLWWIPCLMLHNSKPQLLSQTLFRIWRLASAAFGQCNIFMFQGRLYSFLAEWLKKLRVCYCPHSYLFTCLLCIAVSLSFQIFRSICII